LDILSDSRHEMEEVISPIDKKSIFPQYKCQMKCFQCLLIFVSHIFKIKNSSAYFSNAAINLSILHVFVILEIAKLIF